jgi:hypothetical protein
LIEASTKAGNVKERAAFDKPPLNQRKTQCSLFLTKAIVSNEN